MRSSQTPCPTGFASPALPAASRLTRISFHRHAGAKLQQKFSVADLDKAFMRYVDVLTITGDPLAKRRPAFTSPATVDASGQLALTGNYGFAKVVFNFQLKYEQEAGVWKVVGIDTWVVPT